MPLVVTLPTLGADTGDWDDKLNAALSTIVTYVNNLEVALGGSSEASISLFVSTAGGWTPAIPSSAPAGIKMFLFLGPAQPTGLPAYVGDDVSAGQIPAVYLVAGTS
jgi:hypothetical protein